jgi:hypothetical protein
MTGQTLSLYFPLEQQELITLAGLFSMEVLGTEQLGELFSPLSLPLETVLSGSMEAFNVPSAEDTCGDIFGG